MEKIDFTSELKSRFLEYVAIDTQSQSDCDTFPSTTKQLDLLNLLAEQMRELGMESVEVDQFGYAMGTIPATKGFETAPVIGFIAHVDTSPDVIGAGVNVRIIENYDGGDITLNYEQTIKIEEYPELSILKGHTLFTTDGTTLLGADDKAGVAEIMTAASILMRDKSIEHGRIRIAFTPDEEVGRGVDFFNLQRFGADFAYTLDGGAEGELEFENFNAAGAKIIITGHNHHPGSAKGRLKNALEIAHELHSMLPAAERPEYTSEYEGFFHLVSQRGDVESAEMEYIIRDHSLDEFEKRKVLMWSCVDMLQKRYGESALKLTLKDQYFNMRKIIEPHPQLISKAEEAMLKVGVTPIKRPIRGGTDGARLSYMGLPCPNLFTGGGNFHSRYEYASLTTMERAVKVIIELAQLWRKY